MNGAYRRLAIFTCLTSILFIHPIDFSTFGVNMHYNDTNTLRYEVYDALVGNVRHTINISNPTTHAVSGGKLLVPLIRNETARHYVIIEDIFSPIGQPTLLNDTSGNMYAQWNGIRINAQQYLTVEINYYVLSLSIRYIANSTLSADYDRSSDLYVRYTKPEELIQSGDPELVSRAEDIINGSSNVFEKASRIYNFVISHLRYTFQSEERGALWALKNGTGDCSEYSYLFVALCRAVGIPARIQTGFVFQSNIETTEDGHMWAEYYLGDYGWIPVDASWHLFNSLDCRHFSSIQSMPEEMPYANYIFNTVSSSEFEDRQTVSLKPCSPDVLDGSLEAENVLKAVQEMKKARSVLLGGEILGGSLILPAETRNAELSLLQGNILLQNTIETDNWSHITDCLNKFEEVARNGWTIVAKMLALYISPLAITAIIAPILLKRSRHGKRLLGEKVKS